VSSASWESRTPSSSTLTSRASTRFASARSSSSPRAAVRLASPPSGSTLTSRSSVARSVAWW
jgi:hypothetical protein